MNLYLISGLGADYRAFQHLEFPEEYSVHHLEWIDNLPNEPLPAYARRMAEKINTNEPFILGGLSFGGLVAIEISQFVKPELLLLFSTVADYREMPLSYRIAGNLSLYKLLPDLRIDALLPFCYWFFGPLNEDGKVLIKSFLLQNKPSFINWSLGRVSTWRNKRKDVKSVLIQGAKDRVFPLRKVTADLVVEGAGHFCVFTHAATVNRFLHQILSEGSRGLSRNIS